MALRRRLIAAAVSAAVSVSAVFISTSVHAQTHYDSVITFGDSLSDGGTYGSRFTTNPGTVWIEMVAQQLGLTLNTWAKGGTNFAQGGQRVAESPGITPTGAPDRPVSAQITQYLAATGGKIAPNSLVTVWAGANDIFVNLDAAGRGLITSAQVQANMQKAATDFVTQVARLQAAGAGAIVVVNLPDIGASPLGLSSSATVRGTFTALSGLYNTLITSGLGQLGGNVLMVDSSGLLREIIANPSAYGFANVTTPACTTSSSITCGPSTLRATDAANTYLFADGVHPTTAGHAALAGVVAAALRAPAQMSILPEAALNALRTNSRVLDQRSRTAALGDSPLGLFVNADFTQNNLENSVDMKSVGLTVGLDRRFGAYTGGIAFGYSKTDTDMFGSNGSFTLENPTLTMFVNRSLGNAFVGLSATAGDLRYTDITRNISIGSATRAQTSSAGGNQMNVGLYGGAWYQYGGWQHGPFARLEYSNIHVKSFAEGGTDSTAMYFGPQRREQVLGTLGWQFTTTWTSGGTQYSPYARLAYEHDFNADARTISSRTVSMGASSFSALGIAPNESQLLLEAGVNARWQGMNWGLSVTGGAGRDSGDYLGVNLGVRIPL